MFDSPPGHQLKRLLIGGSSKINRQAPVDAYLLCSVRGHLVISEMINVPVIVVSLYFPVLCPGMSTPASALRMITSQSQTAERKIWVDADACPEGDQGDSLPGS